MAMAAATIRWTAEMVRALPDDGKRYEVVDGELLVAPAPSWAHQAASRKLFLRLHPYLASCGIGEAILAPANVEFANLIERWRPSDDRPEMLADRLAWQPDPAHSPLEIDLGVYFADVHGE